MSGKCTVKRFGLLQPYLGYLSCIPVVCMTHKFKEWLLFESGCSWEASPFC